MLHVDSELSVTAAAHYKTPGHMMYSDCINFVVYQTAVKCDSQKTCRNCLMAVNTMCRNCSRIGTGIGDSSWELLK